MVNFKAKFSLTTVLIATYTLTGVSFLIPMSSSFAQSTKDCVKAWQREVPGLSTDQAFQQCKESGFPSLSQPSQPLQSNRCLQDLAEFGIFGKPAEIVCKNNPYLAIQPDSCNPSGCYPVGGGCNPSGCWIPGGGCNPSGCWPPGGSSNPSGTTVVGTCKPSGCPSRVDKKLFNIKGKIGN
jgi:hypothetical protein